jgi:hypothetical protein
VVARNPCTLHPDWSIREFPERDLTDAAFPVATAPEAGGVVPIAPGVLWLRMPLPFALNHINLWLLDDDTSGGGFSMPMS